jgi:hypothetical protein
MAGSVACQGSAFGHARIVDENGNETVRCLCRAYRLGHRFRVGHIANSEMAAGEVGGGLLQGLAAATDQGNRRAGIGESQRDRAPDAASAPRDDRMPPLEFHRTPRFPQSRLLPELLQA